MKARGQITLTSVMDGVDGENGVGVESVVIEYCLADSDEALTGEETWTEEQPEIPDGQYLWQRSKITYTDGNVDYVGVYCISAATEDAMRPELETFREQTTSFVQEQTGFLWEALDSYEESTSDGFESMEKRIAELELTASGLKLEVSTEKSEREGADAPLQEQYEQYSRTFEFGVEGLRIKLAENGEENALSMLLSHDKLSFQQSGQEVAYLSDRKLYVTDGHFLNSLRLGSFAFMPRQNGNLSLVKVE